MTPVGGRGGGRDVYGALILVQVFFGLHYLAAKIVLEEIPPAAWALIRVSSAALIMLLVARAWGRRLPREWPVLGRLALLSVIGVVINQLFFVEGLSRTTASHSSILITAIPIGTPTRGRFRQDKNSDPQ